MITAKPVFDQGDMILCNGEARQTNPMSFNIDEPSVSWDVLSEFVFQNVLDTPVLDLDCELLENNCFSETFWRASNRVEIGCRYNGMESTDDRRLCLLWRNVPVESWCESVWWRYEVLYRTMRSNHGWLYLLLCNGFVHVSQSMFWRHELWKFLRSNVKCFRVGKTSEKIGDNMRALYTT